MAEQPASFYNQYFQETPAYRLPFEDSHYFPLWVQVEFQLRPFKQQRILDLGCGPGQFAQYLKSKNYPNYRGVDFSEQAVNMARQSCDYPFEVGDALTDSPYQKPFDAVVSLEMLEHIQGDLQVLNQLPHGTFCVFSVPNFDHPGHVRWFRSEYQVRKRYYRLIDIQQIHFINNIYLCSGTRSDFSPNLWQRLLKTRKPITPGSLWARVKHRLVHALKIPHAQ